MKSWNTLTVSTDFTMPLLALLISTPFLILGLDIRAMDQDGIHGIPGDGMRDGMASDGLILTIRSIGIGDTLTIMVLTGDITPTITIGDIRIMAMVTDLDIAMQ